MGKFKDLTGMKFGKLRVLERAGYDNHKKILWKCDYGFFGRSVSCVLLTDEFEPQESEDNEHGEELKI